MSYNNNNITFMSIEINTVIYNKNNSNNNSNNKKVDWVLALNFSIYFD